MNELMPFSYEGSQVRTVIIDGEPWFVAKDVCEILELGDTGRAIDRLESDEGTRIEIDHPQSPGKLLEVYAVNEPGLYSLILGSRKPEAKAFKRWVTHEVIPQIRKTGTYALRLPQNYGEALRELANVWEEKEALKETVAIMAPKADFFDAVADSKDAIDIGCAAKVLNCGIGRTRLFKFLRDSKILMQNNIPYQEFIDRGYFRVIEQSYSKPDGTQCVNKKTLVYQKGLDFIRRLLTKDSNKVVAIGG